MTTAALPSATSPLRQTPALAPAPPAPASSAAPVVTPAAPAANVVRVTPWPVMPWVRRFTVEEYQWLVAQGFFSADERFELLDGLIVGKMPRDPLHDACLAQTRRLLDGRLPPGWHVRVQSAVVTGDSQPEPDLALVRGSELDYSARHPGAADAILLVEVSNTSLADDRFWKGSIYARAGFPLYWIVNLIDRRLEVYSDPSGPDSAPAYRRRDDYPVGQSVPLILSGAAAQPVPVDDLLPPVQPSRP